MPTIGYIIAVCCAVGVTWHARAVQIVKERVPTMVLMEVKSLIAAGFVATLISLTPWGSWTLPASLLFWMAVGVMIGIEFLIDFAYTKSHQKGEQSQVGPLMGITPIFLLPVGILILGDTFTIREVIGVLLVGSGCVLANWKHDGGSLTGALMTIWNSPGARWMLFHALMGVIALGFAKFNFNAGAPVLQFAFWVLLGQSLIAAVLASARKEWRKVNVVEIRNLLHVGVSFGFVQSTNFVGLSLLPAAFFASIKRLSVIFDVLVGRKLGGEVEWFGQRFWGAVMLFIGVVLFSTAL